MAPELFGQKDVSASFTSAVDVWSLGAVAFCVRTGKAPFENTFELCKFSSGTMRFPTQPLMNSSGAFVDFVFSLMEKSPAFRLTMTEVLEHEWMRSAGAFAPATTKQTLQPTQPTDKWEVQASATWNTTLPSTVQPSVELDKMASQETMRPVIGSTRSLPIRVNYVPPGHSAQPELAPSPVTALPSPQQRRPENAQMETGSSLTREPSSGSLDLDKSGSSTSRDLARTVDALVAEGETQRDRPGWLHDDGGVTVSCPNKVEVGPGRAYLDFIMNRTVNHAYTINTLYLHRRQSFSGPKTGIDTTGFASLSPLKTNYIFTSEVKNFHQMVDDMARQVFAKAFALVFNSLLSQEPIIHFLVYPFLKDGADWLRLEEYKYITSGPLIKYLSSTSCPPMYIPRANLVSSFAGITTPPASSTAIQMMS